MSLDFLYARGPLDGFALEDAERIALAGDTLPHQLAGRLLLEVRRLRLEVARVELERDDPQYQYGGGRIHRHAVVCRNASIDALTAQVAELKKGGKP